MLIAILNCILNTEMASRITNEGVKTASSFNDIASAEKSISKIFKDQSEAINKWFNGAGIGEVSKQKFTTNIGENIERVTSNGIDFVDAQSASMRLVKDKEGRVIIHTAFPHK